MGLTVSHFFLMKPRTLLTVQQAFFRVYLADAKQFYETVFSTVLLLMTVCCITN